MLSKNQIRELNLWTRLVAIAEIVSNDLAYVQDDQVRVNVSEDLCLQFTLFPTTLRIRYYEGDLIWYKGDWEQRSYRATERRLLLAIDSLTAVVVKALYN